MWTFWMRKGLALNCQVEVVGTGTGKQNLIFGRDLSIMFQTFMGSWFESDCGYFLFLCFTFIRPKIEFYITIKVEIFTKKCNANESGQRFGFPSFSFLQPRKGLSLLWDDRKFFSA